MPEYRLTMFIEDSFQGTTSRQIVGTFDDFATARVDAVSFVAAMEALTDAGITRWFLTEENTTLTSPTGPNSVFNIGSLTARKLDGKLANFKVPSLSNTYYTGNRVNTADAAITAVSDLLTGGANSFAISDGEGIAGFIRGKRVFDSSGTTNLPV